MEPELDWVESALRVQFVGWLESLRAQEAAGVPSRAPLREMVMSTAQLNAAETRLHAVSDPELIELVKTFQEQLKSVSVY